MSYFLIQYTYYEMQNMNTCGSEKNAKNIMYNSI